MADNNHHFGVFAVEGQWIYDDPDQQASLRGLLEVLKSWGYIKYRYHDACTAEEFRKLLDKWAERGMEDYRFAYLASHGTQGKMWLDEDADVSLAEIGEQLEGACHGCVIHLGGCKTLAAHEKDILDLLRQSQSLAVCGYVENVDTVAAAALELILIATLSGYTNLGSGLTRLDNTAHFQAMADKLGFRVWRR